MSILFQRHHLWTLIRPIEPGKLFLGGWMLSSHDIGPALAKLRFTHKEGGDMELRLFPAASQAPFWDRTATTGISLVKDRPLTREMTLAKTVAALVRRNEAGIPQPWQRPGALGRPSVDLKHTDIQISHRCYNHCRFCSDRPPAIDPLSREEARQIITSLSAQGYRSISFTALEPTMRPDILELVALARARGFVRIEIITNGLRTRRMDFARGLYAAGVDHVVLSLHSPDPDTEALLTGNRQAFDHKARSLENLAAAVATQRRAGRWDCGFSVNTVMTDAGADRLAELARFIAPFLPQQHTVIYPVPVGACALAYQDIAPRLQRLDAPLESLVETALRLDLALRINDMPLCHTPGFTAATRQAKMIHASMSQNGDLVQGLASEVDSRRVYPEPCRHCAVRHRCPGVYDHYLHLWGHAELHPFAHDPLAG